MNILVDKLPQSVEIGGVEYQINTGFRTSILFEMLVRNKKNPGPGQNLGDAAAVLPGHPAR